MSYVTAVAVFDGKQWASLCPEYDIASCGATADEAIANVQAAVSEALAYATEKGLVLGSTSWEDLGAFVDTAQPVGNTFSQAIYLEFPS